MVAARRRSVKRRRTTKLTNIKAVVKKEVAKEMQGTRLQIKKFLHNAANKLGNVKRLD